MRNYVLRRRVGSVRGTLGLAALQNSSLSISSLLLNLGSRQISGRDTLAVALMAPFLGRAQDWIANAARKSLGR